MVVCSTDFHVPRSVVSTPDSAAMADDGTVRRRKPERSPKTKKANTTSEPEPVESEGEIVEKKPKTVKKRLEEEDAYSPYVDILRVLTFLFLASCGLSYLISSGETFFWGMKNPPNYLTTNWWKTKLVATPFPLLRCQTGLTWPARPSLPHPRAACCV